jgi:hypothetical protein
MIAGQPVRLKYPHKQNQLMWAPDEDKNGSAAYATLPQLRIGITPQFRD